MISLPGHTGGDSVVLIPDAKVAFAGDLFWLNISPNTINASIRPWIATLDAMVKNGAEFTFVPGHGDTGTAQDVTVFRDYLATLLKAVAMPGRKDEAQLTEAVMSAGSSTANGVISSSSPHKHRTHGRGVERDQASSATKP